MSAIVKPPFSVRAIAAVLAIPAVLIILVGLLLPLAMLFVFSFWKTSLSGMEPTFVLDNYRRFLAPIYVGLLVKSLTTGLLVTLILLLFGYPFAYFIARYGGRLRTLLLLLLIIPFWTGYLLRSFAWLPLLGQQGLLNSFLLWLGLLKEPSGAFLYNEFSVVLGLCYVFFPFMILPIYFVLERADLALLEAAADLGASPSRAFWRVTVPLSMPGVVAGSIFVFMNTVGAYVTPKLLGGTSGIMYGNAIVDQFSATYDLPFGATLSFIMILSVMLFIFLLSRISKTNLLNASSPH